MPIYDYSCPQCGFFEQRAGYKDCSHLCPACGRPASRSAVYQIAIGSVEKKYRVSDVVEASQQLEHSHGMQEERQGRKLKFPSPYKAAMRKVHASL